MYYRSDWPEIGLPGRLNSTRCVGHCDLEARWVPKNTKTTFRWMADQNTFEKEIRPTGFYRTKAAHIIATATIILDTYNGRVPNRMQDLVRLPGVARKTANIVLAGAFHIADGIAVDTHVKRLAGRMGLSTNTISDKIEQDLMSLLSKSFWLDTNFVLVNHGRATCPARKPRCTPCVIRHLCPYTPA